jgi:nicotinamidase-related amidase
LPDATPIDHTLSCNAHAIESVDRFATMLRGADRVRAILGAARRQLLRGRPYNTGEACGLLPTVDMPHKKIASARRSRARSALLLIDFMNPLDFDGAKSLAPYALKAASHASLLAKRTRERGEPVIYANDNFGRWESDFKAVVADCERRGGTSAAMAKLLAPAPGDRSILKPRHSAFFGTPLDFLLDELQVSRLVLCGIAADSCVMFTAHDAYLRQYALWIPGDCVASEKDAWRRDALAYMARVMKAETKPLDD